MIPPAPVPTTLERSTLFSSASLAAAGLTLVPPAGAEVGSGVLLDFAGAAAAGSVGAAAGAEAVPCAVSSIFASRAPTSTFSPSSAIISEMAPDADAVTSRATLSVSSSQITSSTVTASPTALYHLPTVASDTDSPRTGTWISMVI